MYLLYLSRTRGLLVRGDTAGALEAARAALRFSPPDFTLHGEGIMAVAEAAAGRLARARAHLAPMRAQLSDARQPSFLEAQVLAEALLAVGDRAAALDLVESVRPRGASLWFALRFPIFDPLRADPRFQRVVQESRPPGVTE
jgi:hypothetical protein